MSRHMIRHRQLSRDTEHRKALRCNLVQSLFEHGQVETTLPRAKEVQGLAEKMITLARGKDRPVWTRRRVIALLHDRRLVDAKQEFTGQSVVQKLFDEIAPKFVDRPGGYTRIIKLAKHRIGDAGDLVRLQLLTVENIVPPRARRSVGHRRRRNEKRHQFAAKLAKKEKSDKSVVETPVQDQTPVQAEAPVQAETPTRPPAPATQP